MESAELFNDVADGPAGGKAYWLTADDGVRLRIGVWDGGTKGTVLLFPGRTEYVEKYGPAAADLSLRGYSTVVIDWRGQGLAARLIPDTAAGYVHNFSDYQRDLAAVVAALASLDLATPLFLLSHSMGGGIALRSLIETRIEVHAAVFSAPMWDIPFSPMMRPVALAVSALADAVGLGNRYAPGTSGTVTYVEATAFDQNQLTTDAAMYAFMQHQARAHPELTLGGPTLHWVHQAMRETAALARCPSPAVPILTFVGSDESIVNRGAIDRRMSNWPDSRLQEVAGGRHEVMMETPPVRAGFFDATCGFFDGLRG